MTQLNQEMEIVGKAIEYLKEERKSIVDSYTNPWSGQIEDKEGEQWVEEITSIIDGLMLGTVAGRAYALSLDKDEPPTVNPELVAQAWEEFCERYKHT